MFKKIVCWWKFRQKVYRGVLSRLRDDPDCWSRSVKVSETYFYERWDGRGGCRPVIIVGIFFCHVYLPGQRFSYALWFGGAALIDRLYFNDQCLDRLIQATKFGPTFNPMFKG